MPFRHCLGMAQHRTLTHPFQSSFRSLTPLLPGILLCAAVSCAAILAERFQVRLAGHAWLGDLVLAILIGTLLRSLVSLPAVASAGIKFSAKTFEQLRNMPPRVRPRRSHSGRIFAIPSIYGRAPIAAQQHGRSMKTTASNLCCNR